MELNSLEALLEDQLKDIYSAESQLVKALPKMMKKASSEDLRAAFEEHLRETENQVNRLKTIGESLEVKLTGKKCMGMEGLIKEGEEMLHQNGDESVIDAGLIAAAQRVEHYEIAAYGTVKAFAEQLGYEDVVKLLEESLEEEAGANDKLTELAEAGINQNAADLSDYEEIDKEESKRGEMLK